MKIQLTTFVMRKPLVAVWEIADKLLCALSGTDTTKGVVLGPTHAVDVPRSAQNNNQQQDSIPCNKIAS